MRPWRGSDTDAALAIYGLADPTGWRTPLTGKVGDRPAMDLVLATWVTEVSELPAPRGRWAIERRPDAQVVGGLAIRLLPPAERDLELSFQLDPSQWGNGYAIEAARALIEWALAQDIDELFGVVAPHNRRAIHTMARLGMQWVGETTKYYDHTALVYRIRSGDLRTADPNTAPGSHTGGSGQ